MKSKDNVQYDIALEGFKKRAEEEYIPVVYAMLKNQTGYQAPGEGYYEEQAR